VTLAEHALEAGVVIEPGEACFLADPAPRNFFRMGYSSIKLEAIEPGVQELARVIERI
jgi:GntR family transcriptional regulator/MocR family aminotransferase